MIKPVDFEFAEEITSRRSAEWGLASLLTGSALSIGSFLMLQINLQIYYGSRTFSLDELNAIRIMAIVGFFVMVGFCSVSLLFGFRSLRYARAHKQTPALGWAGVMMSLWAMLLWIGTLFDLWLVVH